MKERGYAQRMNTWMDSDESSGTGNRIIPKPAPSRPGIVQVGGRVGEVGGPCWRRRPQAAQGGERQREAKVYSYTADAELCCWGAAPGLPACLTKHCYRSRALSASLCSISWPTIHSHNWIRVSASRAASVAHHASSLLFSFRFCWDVTRLLSSTWNLTISPFLPPTPLGLCGALRMRRRPGFLFPGVNWLVGGEAAILVHMGSDSNSCGALGAGRGFLCCHW
ncbi:uncharacterized protein [Physcomitrium patens]|uniref:uncharacterized protein n=1 Tax=Physcomitrium patens TaxID=3218 RepID=UPI003CCDD5CE